MGNGPSQAEGCVPFLVTSTLGLPLSFQGTYLQGFRQLTTLDLFRWDNRLVLLYISVRLRSSSIVNLPARWAVGLTISTTGVPPCLISSPVGKFAFGVASSASISQVEFQENATYIAVRLNLRALQIE